MIEYFKKTTIHEAAVFQEPAFFSEGVLLALRLDEKKLKKNPVMDELYHNREVLNQQYGSIKTIFLRA